MGRVCPPLRLTMVMLRRSVSDKGREMVAAAKG